MLGLPGTCRRRPDLAELHSLFRAKKMLNKLNVLVEPFPARPSELNLLFKGPFSRRRSCSARLLVLVSSSPQPWLLNRGCFRLLSASHPASSPTFGSFPFSLSS